MADFFSILVSFSLSLGTWLIFIKLMNDNLRVRKSVAYTFAALYLFLWYVLPYIIGESIVLELIGNLYMSVMPLILCRVNLINTYNIYFCILIIVNFITNTFTAFAGVLYFIAKGEDVQWLTYEFITPGMLISILICLFLSFILCYYMLKKLKPDIMNLKGKPKYLIFIFGPSFSIVVASLKIIFTEDYSINPGGFILLLESIMIFSGITSLTYIFLKKFKDKRKENRKINSSIEEMNELYHNRMRINAEIRELNHDLKNYMVAASPEMKAKITSYVDKIVSELDKEQVL